MKNFFLFESFKNNFFSILGGQHTTPADPGLRLKVFCGEWGVAILSWGVAIIKFDFSVSLCQFPKKRPKKRIDKEHDN